jgi:hypothetical protein
VKFGSKRPEQREDDVYQYPLIGSTRCSGVGVGSVGENMRVVMKIRPVTLMVIITLMTTISAGAETALWGVGAKTCGIFASNYLINPKLADDLYHSWAQGFMSGLNYAKAEATGDRRDLLAMSTDNQMARIKKYCNAHPLADYVNAIMDLYKDLPEIKKTQKK